MTVLEHHQGLTIRYKRQDGRTSAEAAAAAHPSMLQIHANGMYARCTPRSSTVHTVFSTFSDDSWNLWLQKTKVQVWLFEQVNTRFEGVILVCAKRRWKTLAPDASLGLVSHRCRVLTST